MENNHEAIANEILINHLKKLNDDHDKKYDHTARGKLANLRYAMRDRLHGDYPVGRVFPALISGGLTDSREQNEWRTLIAGLFGYAHDEVLYTKGISLGMALRNMYEIRQNDSLEKRFMALLNCDAEHLPGHLRQSVSLLKTENVGLDWGLLLTHVLSWSAPGKLTQKRWVEDYYKPIRENNDEPNQEVKTEIAPDGSIFTEGDTQ